MKIALCSIAKQENDYINEWCQYHIKKGFDKIIILDNNDFDYEPVISRIDEDIKKYVEIIDVKGKLQYQIPGYINLYNEKKNNYDWLLFTDVDCFVECKQNIHDILNNEKYNNFEMIGVNVINYGDSNKIFKDNTPVYEKYTNPTYTVNNYSFFIRGNLDTPKHYMNQGFTKTKSEEYKQCLVSGKILKRPFNVYKPEQNVMFIKHFFSKTIDEFIDFKLKRTNVMFTGFTGTAFPDQYFFRYNEKTLDKLKVLNAKFDYYNPYPVDIIILNDVDATRDNILKLKNNVDNLRFIYVITNKNLSINDDKLKIIKPSTILRNNNFELALFNGFSEYIIIFDKKLLNNKIKCIDFCKNNNNLVLRKSKIDIDYLNKYGITTFDNLKTLNK